jgi:ribose-phosphate pyrophosphokinase
MIKVNGKIIEQNHFPDNTLNIKAYDDHKSSVDIEWNYENDAELFTIICLRKHYHNKIANLFLPYLPHARMDRVKEPGDVFTLKYFCETINSLNFKRVIILDPHSNVGPALLDRVEITTVNSKITNAINNIQMDGVDIRNLVAFYPDEGSMKRYSDCSALPYAFGIKKREWKTGKILGLNVMNNEELENKTVFIIDDICSRGGTFYHSAKAIKNYTDKEIYLYITHCEETILKGDLLTSGLVKKIYTANPLFKIPEEYKNIIIKV